MTGNKIIVLITGGNSGIGYSTAECIAASSADYHVIIASRSQERGEKALSELKSQNPNGSFSLVQLDVTDQKSVGAAAKLVVKDFGKLDILINNAGIIARPPSFLEQLRQTFETNTFGPAVVTEAFTPLLEKSKDGRLIYVTSGLGSITERSDLTNAYYKLPGIAYRMSKSALNMLAVCHHVELGPKGIKVWTFCPGYVVTNLSGTGEKGRQERTANGAGDSKENGDVGKFVNKDGCIPW
ncbi:short chain dehydrogenase [Halenospora varia]|nr:short chain dehydrogenase [Halenospora varia]